MEKMQTVLVWFIDGVPNDDSKVVQEAVRSLSAHEGRNFDAFSLTTRAALKGASTRNLVERDPEKIHKKLLKFKEEQQRSMVGHIEIIMEELCRKKICTEDRFSEVMNAIFNLYDCWTDAAMRELANIVCGSYHYDVDFYDGMNGTSKVSDRLMQEVELYPQEFALVQVGVSRN